MKIDVCFTPKVVNLFDLKGKNVVVIDIFRATSTMTTALGNGVKSIIPVSNLDDCIAYPENSNTIKAAERGGKKVEGFMFGNSPFDYINSDVQNKELIMTTTNGTRAINLSQKAENVIIGSFLNISAVCKFLTEKKRDTIMFCAGWKGNYNLEDSLFAGVVIHRLQNHFDFDSDGALSSTLLYEKAKFDGFDNFLQNSSHYKRLNSYENKKDIDFCLQFDKFDILPILKDDKIVVA